MPQWPGFPEYDRAYPLSPSELQDVRAQLPRQPRVYGNPNDPTLYQDIPRIVSLPEFPLEDASGPQLLTGDQGAEVCRRRIAHPAALTACVRVYPTCEGSLTGTGVINAASGLMTSNPVVGGANTADSANPMNNRTTPAGFAPALPANIKQSLEVIGYFRFGHQDMSIEIPFNMLLGQFIRLSQMASAVSVFARLTTRYYPKITNGGACSWLIDPTLSNFQRNNAFDTPPPASAGAVFDGVQPIGVQGFVGEGFSAPVPPQRIFYGWVDAGVAQNFQHICPVPRGAQTVLLMADASTANNDPAAGGAFQGFALTFNQICLSPGGATTRRTLNFPPNVTIPLRGDCVAIEVVNIAAAPAVAIPFELQYDIGF